MFQGSHVDEDHATKQTLDVGLIRSLFPANGVENFAHKIKDEESEGVKVVCVCDQVLDLADRAVDAAPHHVALVVLERLQFFEIFVVIKT